MAYIIVPRHGHSIICRSGKAPRFYPHFNTALGKFYHSEKDMTSDMRKQGLEFVKDGANEPTPKRKKYGVSDRTRGVLNAIKSQTDAGGNFRPSGRLLDVLRAQTKVPSHHDVSKMDHTRGGFSAAD